MTWHYYNVHLDKTHIYDLMGARVTALAGARQWYAAAPTTFCTDYCSCVVEQCKISAMCQGYELCDPDIENPIYMA